MGSKKLTLAGVAVAASAALPGASAFAVELPGFSCGSASAITWASGSSSQPTFLNLADGATGSVGCDGPNFLQPIPRKSGEGQKDFLKLTLKEAFLFDGESADAELKIEQKFFQKLVGSADGVPLFDTYFDVVQNLFLPGAADPFGELFLGLKISTLGKFVGAPTLKWDNKVQSLYAFIPLQDEVSSLAFTSAPTGIPEPETWAVLTTGLAGLGALARRRRKTARGW